jgi:3-methylfumaryl-CoA hydratase
MTSVDIALLRTWIGRVEECEDVITIQLARRLYACIDYEAPPLFPQERAPLLIHWCLAPAAPKTSELGIDGHAPPGGFIPPVPLPRRMWAAGKLKFHNELLIGDEVLRRSQIADVALKEGRTGLLCFVQIKHEISTARGLAISEEQTLVYRAAELPAHKRASEAVANNNSVKARWQRTWTPSSVALFRYSALTFNSHRIHYDRQYATKQEGYKGLVVHGPLQATLLLHLASAIKDATTPSQFEFQAKQPLFDGSEARFNAVEAANGLDLWSCDSSGKTSMIARASWQS